MQSSTIRPTPQTVSLPKREEREKEKRMPSSLSSKDTLIIGCFLISSFSFVCLFNHPKNRKQAAVETGQALARIGRRWGEEPLKGGGGGSVQGGVKARSVCSRQKLFMAMEAAWMCSCCKTCFLKAPCCLSRNSNPNACWIIKYLEWNRANSAASADRKDTEEKRGLNEEDKGY